MRNASFVIRHVTDDEILTQGGWCPRKRQTSRGEVIDDEFGMEFPSEDDARLYLSKLGQLEAGHQIVPREVRDAPESGGIGQVKTEDFYGLNA